MRILSVCFFLVVALALSAHGGAKTTVDDSELDDDAIFDLIDRMGDGHEEHVLAKEIGKLVEFSKTRSSLGCSLCSGLVGVVKLLAKLGKTKTLSQLAVIICRLIDYAERDVCTQIVDVYDDSVYGVLKYTALNNRELCSLFLDCGPITNPAFDWNITLPDVPKPPVQSHVLPAPNSKTYKVLHLADIHIDFEYVSGSVADCAQPLCCRKTSTVKDDVKPRPDQLAGQWGDYRNCDLPFWTYENMLRHIAEKEDFDYVYWTGDIPPHEMWGQTKDEQISAIRWVTAQFHKYFPNKKVFTSVGNHESEPSNLFPMPNIKGESMKWLYDELAENWIQNGLPNSLRADIRKGAFYTLEVTPGFRIIGLNTNYCHFYNFWLFINTTDPLNQLDWLAKTLQESENKGEKVHILGHYPPSSCLKSWSENYYRIVNRYESTITGMFYGHTHNDEFQIFYDPQDSSRPTEVAYITGSVTTWPTINPGYRIFTVNGEESGSPWEILEVRNVYVNLTEANKSNKPQWVDEYLATESFEMTSLFPEDWNELINRMLADIDGPLVDKLIAYWTKSAVLDEECDSKCRRDFVCKFKQARSATQIPC